MFISFQIPASLSTVTKFGLGDSSLVMVQAVSYIPKGGSELKVVINGRVGLCRLGRYPY